jgi:hypothetical protein
MSTGNWRIKYSEITRAGRAVQAAGFPVRVIEFEIDGWVLRFVVGEPTVAEMEKVATTTTDNEWDEVFKENDGSH